MAKRARSERSWESVVVLTAAVTAAALFAAFSRREPALASAEPAPSFERGAAFDEDDGAAQAPEGPPLRGRVLESMDVSAYTYLRLATPGGEVWAAVSRAPVATGSDVTIVDAARMEQFTSTTLKRTFDVIYFGRLSDAPSALPANHPPLGAAPPAADSAHFPAATVPHATGTDAFDIAELHEKRHELAGHHVKVSGQVVKVTSGVMGKNYVRLRDASGNPGAQRELVITCQFEPKLGEVVTVQGILRVDVDLGIGIVYPVLVEDASAS